MILKRGDNSTNVALWQSFLISQGFKEVVADASFGPMTEAATKGFQKMCVLREDGIVGDNTIAQATARGFKGFYGSLAPVAPAITPKRAGALILLSAGHTNVPGQDRGVSANGYIEGDAAVVLRDHLAAKLRGMGMSIITDGADGVSEPLTKAIVLARKADLALEFHFNAGPLGANGVEVLSKPAKKEIGQKISRAISSATGLSLRGTAMGWKADNSGQHHRLGFCEAGGLIVETCFMSNASDMAAYEANFETLVNKLAEVIAAW